VTIAARVSEERRNPETWEASGAATVISPRHSFYLLATKFLGKNSPVKTSSKILWFGLPAIIIVWAIYGIVKLDKPVEKWGVFGDKFGALNTLFTGLAFVALIATLWHEREKSADAEVDHQKLLAAMAEQTRATIHNAKLQGTIAMFTVWSARHASAVQERETQLLRGIQLDRQWESTAGRRQRSTLRKSKP